MTSLHELVGIAPDSPEVRRAETLADNDRALLRALVEVREAQGLSQSEVGRRMGISQPSVAAFERYDANPQLSTIRRYANAVGAVITHNVRPECGQENIDSSRVKASRRTDYSAATGRI